MISFSIGSLGTSSVRLGPPGSTNTVAAGGSTIFAAPTVSPAYIGVGYIIGPQLASLNFAGGVFAWGHADPAACLLPRAPVAGLHPGRNIDEAGWAANANAVWRFIVRPIAVGGMLVGARTRCSACASSLSAGLGARIRRTPAGRGPPRMSVAPSSI